jgi:nucleoside phosphorylase
MSSHRRTVLVTFAALLLAGMLVPQARAASPRPPCAPRTLVLAAMPLELNPLIRETELDISRTVVIEGRTFYAGRLRGKDVVLAMTGIGLNNAEQTSTIAIEHSRCPFTASLFSGVAGSSSPIGDVMIPKRWSRDDGKTWTSTDDRMFNAARALAGDKVKLSGVVPVGDAACACPGVDAGTPVDLRRTPEVHVGGSGVSYDNFGTKAVPCLPGGGDIAGCAPCLPGATREDIAAFAGHAPSVLDPSFIAGQLQPPAATTDTMQAQDMETAAVAQVMRRNHVPFLGIRAVSDGPGDPLGLPGFPAQFFVYRQLAGNNAAAVAMAFLRAWPR